MNHARPSAALRLVTSWVVGYAGCIMPSIKWAHVIATMTVVLAMPLISVEGGGPAQESAASPQLVHHVDVDVVSVEVVATDRDGSPVADLGDEDFELLIDGDQVPITSFLAGRPSSSLQATSSTTDPLSYLVIVVDNSGGRQLARNAALGELINQLPRFLGSSRRVMLVSMDGRARVLHRFEESPELLEQRIRELGDSTVAGAPLAAEQTALVADLNRIKVSTADNRYHATDARVEVVPTDEARSLLPRIRLYARSFRDNLLHRLQMLSGVIDSLAGLQGRKVVLYIGEGFQTEPGEALFRVWAQRYPELSETEHFVEDLEIGRYRLGPELAELASLASSLGVTIYPLSTATAAGMSPLSAESSGVTGSSDTMVAAQRALEASLGLLAGTTGGKLVAGGKGPSSGLARLLAELDVFYSLGFNPSLQSPESPHRIDVRVRRDGVQLRHRETFLFKTIDDRMIELTRAVLLYEPLSNPLEARLDVEEISHRADGGIELAVAARLPLEKVALVPGRGAHVGRVKVFFAIKDGQGKTSDVRHQSFPVTIPNASLQGALGEDATFVLKLETRPGRYTLAVTLRDDLAATVSTLTLDLDVPAAQPG